IEIVTDIESSKSDERDMPQRWHQMTIQDRALVPTSAGLDLRRMHLFEPIGQPGSGRQPLIGNWEPTRDNRLSAIPFGNSFGLCARHKVLTGTVWKRERRFPGAIAFRTRPAALSMRSFRALGTTPLFVAEPTFFASSRDPAQSASSRDDVSVLISNFLDRI